jgi:hypothetical protein
MQKPNHIVLPYADAYSSLRPSGKQCSAFDTCYGCSLTRGCVWCIESEADRSKPACVMANNLCNRAHEGGPKTCPMDGIAGLKQPPTGAVKCADLTNCRECLRYTYQCRWCISGASSRGWVACRGKGGNCALGRADRPGIRRSRPCDAGAKCRPVRRKRPIGIAACRSRRQALQMVILRARTAAVLALRGTGIAAASAQT